MLCSRDLKSDLALKVHKIMHRQIDKGITMYVTDVIARDREDTLFTARAFSNKGFLHGDTDNGF